MGLSWMLRTLNILACVSVAPSSVSVRLYGHNVTAGLVQVNVGDVWGTVCDDHWDSVDAGVVCAELGLQGGTAIRAAPSLLGLDWRADVMLRDAPIHLVDVMCTGDEPSVLDCPTGEASQSIFGWGMVPCDHSEDAGVLCVDAQPVDSPAVTTQRPHHEPTRLVSTYLQTEPASTDLQTEPQDGWTEGSGQHKEAPLSSGACAGRGYGYLVSSIALTVFVKC